MENASLELMLVAESGLPHRSAERIAAAWEQATHKPVLFLGDPPAEHGRPHLLRRSGPPSLPFLELERLPLLIEQTLRSNSVEKETRLKQEILRAADAVGRDQKLITLGRLAGSIAHEINNPLESITNLLYLTVHEPGLPSQARTYLQLAQRELSRVVEISKQTLTFNRETAKPIPVHMTELLEEVLGLYRRRIVEKCIVVDRQYDAETPAVVFPGEVRQVFSNLIGNAIEAMEKGGRLAIRVRATTLPRDGKTPALRISIADTGAGMPPEIRARLGEPFFTTKGQRGTGLGLWVTQSIVRRHGGSLRLRSRMGERHGTVFTIFLPLLSPPDAEKAMAGESYTGEGGPADAGKFEEQKHRVEAVQEKNGSPMGMMVRRSQPGEVQAGESQPGENRASEHQANENQASGY